MINDEGRGDFDGDVMEVMVVVIIDGLLITGGAASARIRIQAAMCNLLCASTITCGQRACALHRNAHGSAQAQGQGS